MVFVSLLMDQDQYVAMASLDLSAAFDVVNVDLLLVRLKKIGLPTDVINLLESWLRDRQCYVDLKKKHFKDKIVFSFRGST
jgi:hypothetical protein